MRQYRRRIENFPWIEISLLCGIVKIASVYWVKGEPRYIRALYIFRSHHNRHSSTRSYLIPPQNKKVFVTKVGWNVGMFNGNQKCLWNKFCLWPNPLVNSCCSLHWRRGTKSIEAKHRKPTNQLRRRQQQVRRRERAIGAEASGRRVSSPAAVRPQSHRHRHHQNVSAEKERKI